MSGQDGHIQQPRESHAEHAACSKNLCLVVKTPLAARLQAIATRDCADRFAPGGTNQCVRVAPPIQESPEVHIIIIPLVWLTIRNHRGNHPAVGMWTTTRVWWLVLIHINKSHGKIMINLVVAKHQNATARLNHRSTTWRPWPWLASPCRCLELFTPRNVTLGAVNKLVHRRAGD